MAKKESQVCPINSNGCRYDVMGKTEVCMFWRKRGRCEIEKLIQNLRSIPNLLKHIEKLLEEGRNLPQS